MTRVSRLAETPRWQQDESCVRCHAWAAGGGVIAATQLRTVDLPTYFQRLGLPPRPPVLVEQVHGARVAVIDETTQTPAQLWLPGYDGLVTQRRGVPLAIRTADCVPVFVYDPTHHAGGVAHAGWRGLGAGIVTALLATMAEQFHSRASDLQLALGPAIRSCCYEVREPLIAQFAGAVVRRRRRTHLDLAAVVRAQARRAGVAPGAIHDSAWCTACHTDRFFSYRREGPSTGRLVSVFMLL